MDTLASELRNKLERVVIEARDVAETGARAALEALAVHCSEPYPHMKGRERELRNKLRARARQLGDRQDKSGRIAINHLAGECAYEHWHRMLFARFLAENNLLIEPQENMAISLAEAEELAKEEGVDVWNFASRCAQGMLPQIFRPEDPLLQVTFATEHMLQLEGLLASLPVAMFTASDALGWVYQFWQSKKKDEVNRSEVKIGADELPAVTQLFTEPYMVSFLLHNTLGAWWAGKRITAEDVDSAESEAELRRKLTLPGVDWEYLRFVRGQDGKGGPWRPAAGTFDGWPKTAAELKVLDPCCGSGHFLVAALHHLVPVRMAEEGLSACEAVDAVLRDNLHGLEIDERCCQIAAFALAFAAWTFPDLPSPADARRAGGEGTLGYRELPELHIACTGIGPQATEEQWVKLAEQSGIPMPTLGREPIKDGLRNLHSLFSQAPTLGSLINPTELPADLITADYETIKPYLTAILVVERADDEIRERAIAAAGMIKAADLLTNDYTLVITNVPYLGRGKQDESLQTWAEKHDPLGKPDLATMFIGRCITLLSHGATLAIVSPQNWHFLKGYEPFRRNLLNKVSLNTLANLGEEGWHSFGNRGPRTNLLLCTNAIPTLNHQFLGIDASTARGHVVLGIPDKRELLAGNYDALTEAAQKLERRPLLLRQKDQIANPDCMIMLAEPIGVPLLAERASCYQGMSTGDNPAYVVWHWEVPLPSDDWSLFQGPPSDDGLYTGRSEVVRQRLLSDDADGAAIRGRHAWGREGVALALTGVCRSTPYLGNLFPNAVPVIIPSHAQDLLPILAFCSSADFHTLLRTANSKVAVDNGYVVKVPFDLPHWQKVAAKKFPDGLPEPETDDPTQWLFHGWPEECVAPLQVAVARLLGYRWPAELDEKMHLGKRARALVKRCEELAKFADDDGIVCIPSVRGEEPAADRLEALLAAVGIEPAKVRELAGGADLDDWFRNSFFEEHCDRFQHRPFIWHIWDGRKRDGFHALVNYHKLAEGGGKGRKLLESLTYSYVGDWISRQKDGVKRGEGGAEDRLAAALELQKRLEAILAGEPPFDIFVRWKPLSEQPIGWEPDINDGVRLNIRPFLASDLPGGKKGAGILRHKPNIKWTKDRGKEPERPKDEYPWFWGWDEETQDFMGGKTFDGNRWNDCHYTIKAKQAARKAAAKK